MKKNNPLTPLLLLELIVLIVVAVMILLTRSGIAFSLSGTGSSTAASSDASADASADAASADDGSADNAIEMSDDSSDGAAEDGTQERLTFSDEVEEILSEMTNEELAAQLFVTTPEELTGVDEVTAAGDSTESALNTYTIAGLAYSAQNFEDEEQTAELLGNTLSYAQEISGFGIFLMVAEMGGSSASPVANVLGYEIQDAPSDIAQNGSTSDAADAAAARAAYLTALGFNTVLGPVADGADTAGEEMEVLTYGRTAADAADYVAADVGALSDAGMMSVILTFPGMSEESDDYSAYQAAIDAGAACVQVSTAAAPDLTGSDTLPCVLSADAAQTLRDEMGFDGILMTGDLVGIDEDYDTAQSAVDAICAGMDLIFITDGFEEAYEAVLAAIEDGTIPQTTLENAVGRILTQKL